MRTSLAVNGLRVLISLFAVSAPSQAASLGHVDFQTSCRSDVQPRINGAVALLHSFEFSDAKKDFKSVQISDPTCVIAEWGLALAETGRMGANASPKILAHGWTHLKPWLNKPAGTEREQMYFDAVRAMYEGSDQAPSEIRWAKYLQKMSILRQKYPRDENAALFYALGLVWTAGPGEKGLAQRKDALDLLLPIFRTDPNSPGAAHYIIHAADTPQLAMLALPAAHKYASIAPDSPHALHMPSHIFNRVGQWQDSINSNLASARVAQIWVQEGRDGLFDELHALNNLQYCYLQLGKIVRAREVLTKIEKLAKQPRGEPWAFVDARIYFDIDTHDWSDALQIEPPPESPSIDNFDVYWIRVIAAAHLGQPKIARAALEEFRKSSSEWTKGHGFGDVLYLALLEAEAWTAFAEGKQSEAVEKLKQAEKLEREHPVYYADVLPRPASEMLGNMLMAMGKQKDACTAYDAALQIAPNRADSVSGAKACRHAGSGNSSKPFTGPRL